jgi:hypothetical protein
MGLMGTLPAGFFSNSGAPTAYFVAKMKSVSLLIRFDRKPYQLRKSIRQASVLRDFRDFKAFNCLSHRLCRAFLGQA